MSAPLITIAGCEVGAARRPFVIAEMSGNHNGDLGRALELIDEIAKTGAQAIKFQTYTPDTITIDSDAPAFRVADDHGLWGGRTLYDLYQQAHTPWEWHPELFGRARERELIPFSSPFDATAVGFLESLDTPCYKIASAEVIDLPLIRAAAATGKPLIMSTGMATLAEIAQAVEAARSAGCTQLALLVCTAAYPADPADAMLRRIPLLRDAFDVHVGLSDHTLGLGVPLAAVAMGAVIIEKHVTLRRADGGVDSSFSLEPTEVNELVAQSEAARLACGGEPRFGPSQAEQTVLQLRRSLFVVADVCAGDEVTYENVRSIRPSGGLTPGNLELVRGRRFLRDAAKGTPLTWDLI